MLSRRNPNSGKLYKAFIEVIQANNLDSVLLCSLAEIQAEGNFARHLKNPDQEHGLCNLCSLAEIQIETLEVIQVRNIESVTRAAEQRYKTLNTFPQILWKEAMGSV